MLVRLYICVFRHQVYLIVINIIHTEHLNEQVAIEQKINMFTQFMFVFGLLLFIV